MAKTKTEFYKQLMINMKIYLAVCSMRSQKYLKQPTSEWDKSLYDFTDSNPK